MFAHRGHSSGWCSRGDGRRASRGTVAALDPFADVANPATARSTARRLEDLLAMYDQQITRLGARVIAARQALAPAR